MAEHTRIRILSVDDHRLFREGMAAVIRNQPDMLLVAEAASGPESLERFCEHQPDVTLMDQRLHASSGLDAMTAILTHFPEARVILVSTFEGDLELQNALQAGAWGHIVKTMHPREIVNAIRHVYAGRRFFRPQLTNYAVRRVGRDGQPSGEAEVRSVPTDENRNRDIGQGESTSVGKSEKRFIQAVRHLGVHSQADGLNLGARRGFIRL